MTVPGSWTWPIEGLLSKALRAGVDVFRSSEVKADSAALIFSAKSFLAAMAAYYIALRIGLPKPYWAIVTVYIVSQSSAGASYSRGLYRLGGTLVGAIATVAIITTFVSESIVCSAVLSGWIGFCLFMSLLDRTPRAYGFVLAGYTASLIGFPSVGDPGSVFDTASLRVQEIGLGVICAVTIHRFVLPKPMTDQFLGKLSMTLRDARRLAADALDGTANEQDRRDRHRLASDLLALQGLSIHLPYDTWNVTLRGRYLSLIHDRIARLLPLATEIEERLMVLGPNRSVMLIDLLDEVVIWTTESRTAQDDPRASQLMERAHSLQDRLRSGAPSDRIVANLAGRLAEMVGLLHDCEGMERTISAPYPLRDPSVLHWPNPARKGYVFHRDPLVAAWGASGSAFSIFVGCLFWIVSAWPEGGLAVSILGVSCALFGTVDAPAPNVQKYLHGLFYGVLISLAYSFLILPRVTEFAVLVAVLAPAFLLAGSLQARLPTTFLSLGITLTIPILANLGPAYHGDFAAALNTGVAVFAAIIFSITSMKLFQTVPVDVAIARLRGLNRRDVRRCALGSGPDEAHWTSLMIDRTALLLPRLPLSSLSTPDVLDETLNSLRMGHAIRQVRTALGAADAEFDKAGQDLLRTIASLYSGRRIREQPLPSIDLVVRAERLSQQIADRAFAGQERLFDSLIDLRFALASLRGTRPEIAA